MFARTLREADLSARPDSICAILHARAEEYGDKPYLKFITDGELLTYRMAADRSVNIARGFIAMGIPTGARLGFVLAGSVMHVLGWFASLQAGMVDVPINPDFQGEVLNHAIQKIEVSAILADAVGLEALSTASSEARAQIQLMVLPDVLFDSLSAAGDLPRGIGHVVPLREVEAAGSASSVVLPDIDPRVLASIRFSSGTTGLPKGVMMDHGHMLSNARKVGELLDVGEGETMYTCFPFHHVFSTVMGVLMTLCGGATMIVARKFSASGYWNDLRQHGVTRAHILDPLIPLLMKQPESPLDRQHNVVRMYTAAGYYPEFEQRFGVGIVAIYDMSELTVVMHFPDGEERRPGSCGKESGLFEIKIADEDGFALPDGAEGEIYVRPRYPNVMFLGYYNDAEQTVAAWRDLWFKTGDRARRDEEGYFYFLGRAGDRIRRRGVNISCEQIEKIASSHPAVLECAAIAVPSALGEDDIKLCIKLMPSVEVVHATLAEDLLETLPRSLTVRYYELLDELPKTHTEKVKRVALRQMGERGLTPETWDHEAGDYWRPAEAALELAGRASR
jgi:crotonobetaine/carnitine-CoA ligase